PGPRWYRPWAPQIVLSNIGRSYKFGYDTRFRADRKVQTRVSGNTLVSLAVGKQAAVLGKALVANQQGFAVPGIPADVVSLVKETLLLDTESAGVMASVAGVAANATAAAQADYTNAIRGVWLSRDDRFSDTALKSVDIGGEPP